MRACSSRGRSCASRDAGHPAELACGLWSPEGCLPVSRYWNGTYEEGDWMPVACDAVDGLGRKAGAVMEVLPVRAGLGMPASGEEGP